MHKSSYIAALLRGKCPRCREGSIFKHPASKISQFSVMNQTCPNCGISLMPEPGFYQGAMYIGYGFTVAALGVIGMILLLLGDPSEWVYVGVIIAVMVLLAPLNYRYSRIVYLFFFGGIKYDSHLSHPK